MTNEETKEHLFKWVKKGHGIFSWPTDACGYEQHIKFVNHRNKNWETYCDEKDPQSFKKFVIDYANTL